MNHFFCSKIALIKGEIKVYSYASVIALCVCVFFFFFFWHICTRWRERVIRIIDLRFIGYSLMLLQHMHTKHPVERICKKKKLGKKTFREGIHKKTQKWVTRLAKHVGHLGAPFVEHVDYWLIAFLIASEMHVFDTRERHLYFQMDYFCHVINESYSMFSFYWVSHFLVLLYKSLRKNVTDYFWNII